MMKSVQRALTFGLVLALTSLASASVLLKEGHPSTYYVKSGDTLWDISGRFLQHPWQWPEIWQINEEISNPHLIYPGDELRLTFVDGQPRLQVSRGVEETVRADGVVRLSPRIREVANDQPIPAIPMSAIKSYLRDGRVLSREQIEQAPYLVGGRDRRVIFGEGDTVYSRDRGNEWDGAARRYGFYRVGERYVDPDTNEVLGYEALLVGEGRFQSNDKDMATFQVTRSSEELRVDDRLFPIEERTISSQLQPSAPDTFTQAKVIRFFDRINSVARNDVVVINKGLMDGLREGNVLDVFSEGEVVRDRQRGEMVRLPRERTGNVIVFRVFDNVSYALVMESTRPIFMHDIAESPQGSY